MNVHIKTLVSLILVLMLTPVTYGAIKYGEATIQKGNVVIVREGRMYLYTITNNPVTLYENDTIRTLKDTALTMQNPDQHRVILGANAIMQLKKWRHKKQQGTIRMLFGKFRARTAALRKTSALNMRTATATIGIKGSLGEGSTNSNFTSLANLSGEMSMTNNAGEDFNIPTGQFGFNVDGQNQQIGLQANPRFKPNQSEDDMENGDSEQLDTDDSKEVDVPSEIEQSIQNNVVEVANAVDGDLGALLDGDQELPDIFPDIPIPEPGSGASPTIKVNIKIED